ESGEPLVWAAVRRDDDRTGAMSLGEDLVGVTRFLRVHLIEAEIIEDEQVDGEELAQLGFVGVEETRLAQSLEYPIRGLSQDGVSVAAGQVAEGMGEEGLSHAHRADDEHVVMGVEEAE